MAAYNLHRRLHAILYEGYTLNSDDGQQFAGLRSGDHVLGGDHRKYESLFIIAEYCAWREQVRQQAHRGESHEYLERVRAVDQVPPPRTP